MAKVASNVDGFAVLPIELPPSSVLSTPSKHYIYLKPHDPSLPDPNAARSLFVANIPVTATELHFRHLFATQLAAGRVERVESSDLPNIPWADDAKLNAKNGRKRKRITEEDLQIELQVHQLPAVWERTHHTSGSYAVVVFVDRQSMEAGLKAAKKAVKLSLRIVWGHGVEDKLFGLQRYKAHNHSQYVQRKELLQSVDSYMSAYSKMEEARTRADAKKRQMPDEEGFVTVTKGTRGGVVRMEDAKELGEKQTAKSKGLDNFYRFQMRERRKEEQGEFLRKFEEDKRRIDEMKERRGRLRVSCEMLEFKGRLLTKVQ